MLEPSQAFEQLIQGLGQRAGVPLSVEAGVCALRTGQGVAWRFALVSGGTAVLIEGDLGPVSQWPAHAPLALLQCNADFGLMQGACVAASPYDNVARLQYLMPLDRLDVLTLDAVFCGLVGVRDKVIARLGPAAAPGAGTAGRDRDERRLVRT